MIGIVGSIRQNSIHRQIFNHYREISSDQFDLQEGVIEGLPMYDGRDMGNPQVLRLAEQVKNADGVIFISPEYNYSIPGVLKNAIDWLSRCDPQPFAGKAATIVGASPGNVGTARMQYHLRQVGVFLNINFMNRPETMIARAMDKLENNRISDSSTVEFLHQHAAAFKAFCAANNPQ